MTQMTTTIAVARTMPNFSMDVYADGLLSGLRSVHPEWGTIELLPKPVDRDSRSPVTRVQKAYERFWCFPSRVRQQQADLYHIVDHSDGHIVSWLRHQRKPVVVTCHDLINFYYAQNLQGSVRFPLISDHFWKKAVHSMRYADAIVCVSTTTANDVSKILSIPEDKIFVVPNAVDKIFKRLSENQIQAIRNKLKLPQDTLLLLNVGSCHPRKNVDAVLQSLYNLKAQNILVKLLKISGKFSENQIEYIRKNHLYDDILHLQKVSESELVEAYNIADILIAPSFHEGFGLTLLEAMACGTPVITANVSAMPEIVADAGILVNPYDIEAIVEAALQLYHQPHYLQSLKEKGLNRSQQFAWGKTAEMTSKIYEALLNKKKYSARQV